MTYGQEVARTPVRTGGVEEVFRGGGDGEIKGPGPFRSMALMVLKNFRDLVSRAGPGFQGFSRQIKGLSGTSRESGSHG